MKIFSYDHVNLIIPWENKITIKLLCKPYLVNSVILFTIHPYSAQMVALFSKSPEMNCNFLCIGIVVVCGRSDGLSICLCFLLTFMSRWRNFYTHFLSIITQFVLNFYFARSVERACVCVCISVSMYLYYVLAWLCANRRKHK